MEVTNLLDIHTRAELYRWYEKNHDKVSDFWLRINRAEADCPGVVRYVDAVEVALCFGWIDSTGEMTPAGLAVAPDLDPALFVFEDWLINAIRADKQAWMYWQSFPETYKRIKADRIQHYQHTNRPEYAQHTLEKLIQDTHNGKLQSGWNDFGRLK